MVRTRVAAAVAGVLAAAVVLGLLDTLVLQPLALAPDTALARIYGVLGAAGDLPWAIGWIVGWAVLWTLVVAVLAVTTVPLRRFFAPIADAATPARTIAVGAVLLGAMTCFHLWSAFAMGVSVGDDVPPYVGGDSPFGTAYTAVGLLVGLLGAVGLVVQVALRRRSSPPARSDE